MNRSPRMPARLLALLLASSMCFALPCQKGVAAETPATSAEIADTTKTKRLTLLVQDEEGRPLAGAKIAPQGLRATVDHGSWYGWNPLVPNRPVLTDAAGRATIAYPALVYEDLEAAIVTALVTHPDYCALPVESDVTHPEPIVLKLGATIHVTALLPNGEPPGSRTLVQLAAETGSWQGALVEWRTEPKRGTATGQVPPGQYQLRAVVIDDHGGRFFSDPVRLDARAGLRRDLGLSVKPGGTIAGRLSGNVPAPVRHGKVMVNIVTPTDDARSETARKLAEETVGTFFGEVDWTAWAEVNPDGTFKLTGVPPGEIAVCAICDGFVSSDPTGSQKDMFTKPQKFPAAQAGELVIAMEPAGVARVTMLTPAGTPLVGTKVWFSPNQSLGQGNGTFGAAQDTGVLLNWWQSDADKTERPEPLSPDWHAVTDDSGVATMPNLPQGVHSFHVFPDTFEMPIVSRNGRADRQGIITIKPGETSSATVRMGIKGQVSLGAQMALARAVAVPERRLTGGWLAVTPGPDFEGEVVDAAGAPLAGVLVDAWTWCPGAETKTDAEGKFRLKKLAQNRGNVEVQFSLAGFSPFHVTRQPTGRLLEKVVLSKRPCFEGVVRDAKGAPLGGQLIRACTGAKDADGVQISHVWAETRSDEQGRYVLRVFPDTYEILVRSAAGEIARLPGEKIVQNETRTLDITLTAGVAFRARIIDSETRAPVAGVRLHHWQHPGVEGTSDAGGNVVIEAMFPGSFDFSVDAEKAGYRRWWSAQAKEEHQRKQLERHKSQRNFDDLQFELSPGMEPVEIEAERGVRISGTVRNPAGEPVAGATVAPALTGTGNSLTGDTRFSVRSKKDGRFEILLPASGLVEHNLVVHDGAYQEWRGLANGILPPMKTKPGEVRENVELALSVPCVVRGRVVDQDGQPVRNREVRAAACDLLENRYYDPGTRTAEDGTFELRHVRAGKQFIQISPFWLRATEAPAGTSVQVTAVPEAPVTGVTLTAKPLE